MKIWTIELGCSIHNLYPFFVGYLLILKHVKHVHFTLFIGFDTNRTFAVSPGIRGDWQHLQIVLLISGSLKEKKIYTFIFLVSKNWLKLWF